MKEKTKLKGHSIGKGKNVLAGIFQLSGLSHLFFYLHRFFYPHGFIRIVNYHDTPPSTSEQFEKQLQWYKKFFEPVSEEDLAHFFHNKRWHKKRPGLIISFDDGLKSNYDTAAPLLKKYGFTGWFFIPTDFIDTPSESQQAFAKDHKIGFNEATPDKRIAMTWEEIRELEQNHVIGCHTRSHCRLKKTLDPETLQNEIVIAKKLLEEKVGKTIDSFCWVGGEENAYSREAAQLVSDSGYRFGFMTCAAPASKKTLPLQIHRSNIESSWAHKIVSFQLCGIMDVLYWPKRRRVNALTTV